MRTVVYQGYTIKSFPRQCFSSGQWTIHLQIFWNDHGVTTMKVFTANTPYATEVEADIHGIGYRQRLVDGTIAGISV